MGNVIGPKRPMRLGPAKPVTKGGRQRRVAVAKEKKDAAPKVRVE